MDNEKLDQFLFASGAEENGAAFGASDAAAEPVANTAAETVTEVQSAAPTEAAAPAPAAEKAPPVPNEAPVAAPAGSSAEPAPAGKPEPPRHTVRIITNSQSNASGVTRTAEKHLANMQNYNFPQNRDEIEDILRAVSMNVVKVGEGELATLLIKWAKQIDNVATHEVKQNLLRDVGSCARKYDELHGTDVFHSVWESVDSILVEYDSCTALLDEAIYSGRGNFGELMTHLLPFFRKDYKRACEFFEFVKEKDKSYGGTNLVGEAWNKIICDPKINEAMINDPEGNYYLKDGKRYTSMLRREIKRSGRNAPDALKARDSISKGRSFKIFGVIAACFAVAIAAVIIITGTSNNAINKDTIVFDYPDTVTLDYGEALDLSMGSITYQNNKGESFTIDIETSMIKKQLVNKVGEQTVILTWGGKDHTVKVTVNPILLEKPTLKFEGGKLTWGAVEGVTEYKITLTDPDENEITADTVSDATEWQIPETVGLGAYVATLEVSKYDSAKYAEPKASSPVSFEKREGVTSITYSDGSISWDAVAGATAYVVTLNGEALNAKGTSIERALVGGNNEITVSVVYGGTIIYTDKTVIIKKLKLEASDLTVNNNKILYDTAANIVLYLDGVEFDGDLSAITAPGEYFLTAKRFASKEGEIDSDMLENITITKLPQPHLTISDNALVVQEGYEVVYYLNGTEFSGNILDVSVPDTYEVTAKFKGTDKFMLDSELSQSVSFTKLAIPEITYDYINKIVGVKDTSVQYELYLNGEAFDGNVANLGEGYFKVTARNVGDGTTSISSAESSAVYITNVDATIAVADAGSYANIQIKTELKNFKYDIVIEFYQGDTQIGIMSKEDQTSSIQQVTFNRNGKIADGMKITVIIYPPSSEYEQEKIEYNWTKE